MSKQARGPEPRKSPAAVPVPPARAHSGRGSQSALEALVKSRIPAA
jgi:hypothetical protein